ncbi:MAG: TIGR00730 family Rossman fold protein [Vulcanimicrobiaceae bacterium]
MRLCVFCGSQPGRNPRYVASARHIGTLLAQRGIGLVYGGGAHGVMGALAAATLAAGGEAVGIIPRRLIERDVAHPRLTALEVVETMHERKARMHALADAFLALPGGFGTLEELFEAITHQTLGFHHKPTGLLDVDGYFAALLAFLANARREGFIGADEGRAPIVGTDPEKLLDELVAASRRRA